MREKENDENEADLQATKAPTSAPNANNAVKMRSTTSKSDRKNSLRRSQTTLGDILADELLDLPNQLKIKQLLERLPHSNFIRTGGEKEIEREGKRWRERIR